LMLRVQPFDLCALTHANTHGIEATPKHERRMSLRTPIRCSSAALNSLDTGSWPGMTTCSFTLTAMAAMPPRPARQISGLNVVKRTEKLDQTFNNASSLVS